MKNIIIILFSIALLSSCIVPPSPNIDYYKLLESNSEEKFYDGVGYVYEQDKCILNLWVFSTPWKTVYLSTNIPVKDSILVLKNRNKMFYLKKLDNQSISRLPHKIYHNDSINVFKSQMKISDNEWYIKKDKTYSDTLQVKLNNKKYIFYFNK